MSAELKGFGTLFSETWEQFKTRALTILGVLLLSTLFVLVGMAVVGIVAALSLGDVQATLQQVQQGQVNGSILSIFGLFFLVVMVLVMWSQSATIAVVVDDNMGVREALRVGWQRLWSMAWILVLAGSIIMTGFLFFVVPGIIFSVSLMLALYPLYEDDQRGMDAILASRRYVKGRWWNTFGKLVLIWLIAIVLDLIPVVGQFLYFLFTPFLLLFLVAMYRNLKETTVEIAGETSRSGLLWLLAIIGMIVPLAGLIAVGPQLPALWQQAAEQTGHQVVPVKPQALPQPSPGVQDMDKQDVPVSTGSGQGVWRDPVDDVAEFGVGRWLDIETVSVQADAGTLLIEVQTDNPLTVSFNAASTASQAFYRLAALYFDTDVNRQTGGPAGKDSGRSGYDFGLDITLEAPRNEPEKGEVHVSLFSFENGLRRFLGPLPEGQVQAQGNRIRLRLPYEALGVQAGNQVRISFLEVFQKQGSGLSKDKLIDL